MVMAAKQVALQLCRQQQQERLRRLNLQRESQEQMELSHLLQPRFYSNLLSPKWYANKE